MTPEQEAILLREFARLNANIGLLRHDQQNNTNEMRAGLAAVTSRLDKHGRRIKALEDKLDHPADDADTTGKYQIDVEMLRHEQQRLMKEQERRTESGIWWKRQTVMWLVGGVGALVMALLTGAGGLIVWALTRK